MKQLELIQVKLQKYKALFIVVISVSALLVASPALQRLLVYPQTEFFTEMWLLGPEHKAENYPFNITRNQNYDVFLGIGNNLGQCAYYAVEVKFRNETISAPDSFNMTPSSLTSLFNMTVFVADKETWEQRLTFSFDYGFSGAMSRVEFNSLALNNVTLDLYGLGSEWNATTSRFYGNLIFELWIYNGTLNSFQYHERFTDLKFNMTVPASS
jgi:hypothetical protein